MTFDALIANTINLPLKAVNNTISLLNDGATIPFIARYRKEATGSLDEVAIEAVRKELDKLKTLEKRKGYILETLRDQNQLTEDLKTKISDSWDADYIEDLYLPFKKKRKTKASVAKENGLEGLARIIMSKYAENISSRAKSFTSKQVSTPEKAIEGAQHIIAEWVSENIKTREYVRSIYTRYAQIESKVVASKKQEGQKYSAYFDTSDKLANIPSHRLLAILRGHSEGFLKMKLVIDQESVFKNLDRWYIQTRDHEIKQIISDAVKDACKRLIFPSIENETLSKAKERADIEAVSVFRNNLSQLLLSPPLGTKSILALDPGFRTGCKLVALDKTGNLLFHSTIYPHPPNAQKAEAEKILFNTLHKYNIQAIAIGNGTAGKETYKWMQKLRGIEAEIYLVNEDGASVYSASTIAREEFPDKDITVRGAVSIGRRLMDPLAELVKIDPKSIGVGQYQHDVDQSLLKDSLTNTVMSCVNQVGVNINTASEHLLKYISGLGDTLAKNIVKYRLDKGAFTRRNDILKVPRMGPKAFEQCAGFLRIPDGEEPLDNTAVHPESYHIVKRMARNQNVSVQQLLQDNNLLSAINPHDYTSDTTGLPTIHDIIDALRKPGLDPRGNAEPVKFDHTLNTIEDIHAGMVLNGIINNITKFGAFVDIGIKESGLVHISEIADRYITDPSEVLAINQEVPVKVISVDVERKRINLSIKQAKL